jgi:hypothetical protein
VAIATVVGAILGVGLIFLRLHTLPERMAHKAHKLQFEIVAVLGLLALFTHQHIFWVAGLLLALVDFPDFSTPVRRMTRAVEKIAGIEHVEPPPSEVPAHGHGEPEPAHPSPKPEPSPTKPEEWRPAAERKEAAHA